LWDKYIKISATYVKVEQLPKEEIEAMRRAVEEAERQVSQTKPRKVEIEVEEE